EEVKRSEIKTEIQPMFSHKFGKDIDVVVLACTHFPLLLNELKSTSSHGISWIDSGQAIAKRTQSLLVKKDKLPLPNYPQTAFLIGGAMSPKRSKMFAKHGFAKTVILPA
ncbi:MAG: aspartate/glutamate racemase family protein, partial [Robiginitomaculum sp.]|nr:aspartate/glutamate racemase family protein [Robiginitomaculum sp.]